MIGSSKTVLRVKAGKLVNTFITLLDQQVFGKLDKTQIGLESLKGIRVNKQACYCLTVFIKPQTPVNKYFQAIFQTGCPAYIITDSVARQLLGCKWTEARSDNHRAHPFPGLPDNLLVRCHRSGPGCRPLAVHLLAIEIVLVAAAEVDNTRRCQLDNARCQRGDEFTVMTDEDQCAGIVFKRRVQ